MKNLVFIIACMLTLLLALFIVIPVAIRIYYVYFPPPAPLVVIEKNGPSDSSSYKE